ncbi:MAG: hypothetical protein ACR2P2_09915 [Nakamurella sp.]
MIMRLRTEASRRKAISPRRRVGAEIADLVTATMGAADDAETVNALRSAAVALAAARQSFMASFDLSDINMTEVMPVITHLSQIAEALVVLSDDLAASTLGQDDSADGFSPPIIHPFEPPADDSDDGF